MPVILDGTNGVSTPNTFAFKNRLINSQLLINQRSVSGTVSLAAGAYGHDRFKAGASGCTYTFATSNNVTTLTISAGSLQQVVEGLNLESGTYTLSWTGTAQGKIGAGSYGASGITGSITGGTNTTIEFNTGTLSLPQLEKGSSATSFDYRPYGTELALCQRYYYKLTPAISGSNTLGVGRAELTTLANTMLFFPVSMRIAPTALEQSGTAGDYAVRYTNSGVATCSSVPAFSDANTINATINLTVSSGLTGGQAVAGRAVNTNAYLAWSAEL
jgi:hypothetical protein